MGFPCGSAGKESTCNVGDLGSIPGLGRSPGDGKGYPLQYSGLENAMDYIGHRVTKSWTQLSDWTELKLVFQSWLSYPPCYSLLISEYESESHSVESNSLWPHGPYSPWNSPGQNTGVGSLSLLQGIFPTQGLSPGLPHCKWILYQLSHKGSPRILEWVAYPFSSWSSHPKNWTPVSCIAGRFFTNWTILIS